MSDVVNRVSARAPAKINLALQVGPRDASGYHPLLTAFQAIDLWETVTITESPTLNVSVTTPWGKSPIPTGPDNTAWQAAELVAREAGREACLAIHIDKKIPVAGGMAGGSADAAATLVALNAFWNLSLTPDQLWGFAREIGADVPFSLHGGAAIGRGRGDQLERVEMTTPLHWVIVPSASGLSTPEVYRHFDGLAGEGKALSGSLSMEFVSAWGAGDARRLAKLIGNDLQAAALELLPELRGVLDDVSRAGALTSAVSGSGPTVFGLAESESQARNIVATLESAGYQAFVTRSTDSGASLVEEFPPLTLG